MEDSEPIACTLTAADMQDRQKAWLKVGAYATSHHQIAGGIAFQFVPAAGVYDSLQRLVRLEAECCPWMTFTLDHPSESIALAVTADGEDGARAVRATFGSLGVLPKD